MYGKLLIILFLSLSLGTSSSDVGEAYDLKFGMMTKIFHFVQWPNTKPQQNEFRFGVFGSNPFPEISKYYSENKFIQNQKFKLYVVKRKEEFDGLHALFVPQDNFKEFLETMDGLPNYVLLVTECIKCDKSNLMINFFEEGDKVRFEINKDQVDNKGFIFNSKLYSLGEIIK